MEDEDKLNLEDLLKAEEPDEAPPAQEANPPEGELGSGPKEGEEPPAVGPKPTAEVPGGQPPAPATPPPSDEKPPVVVEPPKVTAPVVPPAPPQPAAPSGPPTAKPPEVDKARVAELRRQHLEALTKHYAPSKEEAEALLTEPEKVLPGLLARTHQDAFDAALVAFTSLLPSMVLELTERQRQDTVAEGKFFSRWPQLKKPELRDKIERVAQVYRTLSPEATPDEAVEAVGAQACFLFGIPVESAPAPPPPPARSKPSAPVGVGASGGAPTKVPEDFWRDLYEEVRRE